MRAVRPLHLTIGSLLVASALAFCQAPQRVRDAEIERDALTASHAKQQTSAQSRARARATAEDDDEERDSPARREEWFRAGRLSTNGKPAAILVHKASEQHLAAQRVLRAKRSTAAKLGTSQSSATPTWVELGPRPQNSSYGYVSGRVTSIAADTVSDPSGNTVYVGTAFGGVWRSTNGLSTNPTFTPLTEGAPTLAVGAIAIDATTSPATIYVGTGEPNSSIDSYYGIGVMKSVDGGVSWVTVSSADGGNESFYGLSFSKLMVDPAMPSVLLACTRYPGISTYRSVQPGIYQSNDSGQTWSLRYASTYGCSDLVYQSSTKTYFAAIRGQGVLSSINMGATWTAASNPIVSGTLPNVNNLKRIALATRGAELWALMVDTYGNLSTPVACGSAGACDTGLSLSLDGGKTWSSMPAPPAPFGSSSQGWYDVYFATSGASSIALGGIDLWTANYNGTNSLTWTNLTNSYTVGLIHPDQHAFAAIDANRWYIGNDGGVWTTTNSGTTWQNANATIGTIQLTSASADASIVGQYFGGSQDNGTALLVPQASVWNTIWNGDGGYTIAASQTPARYLTENYDISLRRSDDRGNTWSAIVGPNTISDYSAFYTPYVFAASDEMNLLLGTCHVWRGPTSALNGAGWASISPDLSLTGSCGSYVTGLAVAPESADTVYAVTRNSYVWMSTNATSISPTWTSIGAYPLPQRPFSAVAVDPLDPTDVYLAVQGFDTGHIFRRIAGTWFDISANLPNIPANSIFIDPQHTQNIYVATDAGVYMTSDAGTPQSNWQLVGAGLPNVAVVELKGTQTVPRQLIAATHGRGLWAVPLDNAAALAAPTLQSPINGASVTSGALQFSWTTVQGATGYRIMAASSIASLPTDPTVNTCAGCILVDTATTNQYSPSIAFQLGSTYAWQVQAYNATTNQVGAWTNPWSFTVVPTPDSLSLSPASLAFGNVALFAHVQLPLQITNTGNTAATISAVMIADTSQFTLLAGCPTSLPAGASCSLLVDFSPDLPGVQQTTLTISDYRTNTVRTVPLNGTGIYGTISLSSTTLNFGSTDLNSSSNPVTLTITNPGMMPLIFGVQLSGNYSGTTTCGAQLLHSQSCAVTVVFRPSVIGPQSGAITIYDNTASGQHTVPLQGSGVQMCGKQPQGPATDCANQGPAQN